MSSSNDRKCALSHLCSQKFLGRRHEKSSRTTEQQVQESTEHSQVKVAFVFHIEKNISVLSFSTIVNKQQSLQQSVLPRFSLMICYASAYMALDQNITNAHSVTSDSSMFAQDNRVSKTDQTSLAFPHSLILSYHSKRSKQYWLCTLSTMDFYPNSYVPNPSSSFLKGMDLINSYFLSKGFPQAQLIRLQRKGSKLLVSLVHYMQAL